MILGPLSLLFMKKIFGKSLCSNMFFEMKIQYFNELLSWSWMMLTMISIWYYIDIISELLCLYVASGCIILLRTILVSLKYGYFPQSNWNKLKNSSLTNDEINKSMLIKSWLTLDPVVAQEEINISFRRLNLSRYDCTFNFSSTYCEECVC